MTTALTVEDISRNRANFNEVERRILTLPQLNESDFQLTEYLSGGLYGRQITIPKLGILTGRIYKFDHVEIMLKGDISILAADGGEKRYTGYRVIEAQAGKRQAGYAHEETTWLTLNRVPDIALDKMLDWTSVKTYEEFYGFHEALDREDYKLFLDEIGMTQDKMDLIVKQDDVVEMPDFPHIVLKPSKREGLGLFSEITIKRGELICPPRLGLNRTIAGRFANHGHHANAGSCVNNGEFWYIALRDIPAGDEITVNYRDVLKFRTGGAL